MPEMMDKQTLHAISADTRQEIIKLLSKRPYTASELSRILDKHVTTVTEHLSVLEKSGVVRKKDSTNKWVYYTLTDKGEKFFRPNFSWVLMLSIAALAFVGGIYQIFYLPYEATTLTVQQSQEAAPMAARTALDVAETTSALDTGIYIGIAALLIALVAGYIAWSSKRRHDFARSEMLRTLNER